MSISSFHVMAMPTGPICNLDCKYCFYLEKENLYPGEHGWAMSDDVVESYVRQYIQAQDAPNVTFGWQGGEPTLLGVEFFREVVELQRNYSNGKQISEIGNQYSGIAVNDPRMEPYYNLAEELDIPVGIHMGPGSPGATYWSAPAYQMRFASLLLLENVLAKHPKLRIWGMHAGWPLDNNSVAALYMHP